MFVSLPHFFVCVILCSFHVVVSDYLKLEMHSVSLCLGVDLGFCSVSGFGVLLAFGM